MARSQWWRRLPPVVAAGVTLLALSSGPEPYRYCQPPPGHTSAPPPARVDHNLRVVNGQSPPVEDSTGESPPQARLFAPLGAFAVPPGAITIRVVIECAPPPSMLPPDGALDGNVYSIAVTAGGAPLSLRPGQQATVVLRGPAGTPSAVLERFDSGLWTKLQTTRATDVPDTYSAAVGELASVALVVSNATVPLATGDDHTGLLLGVVGVALAIFAAGALVVMRGRAGGARRGADS